MKAKQPADAPVTQRKIHKRARPTKFIRPEPGRDSYAFEAIEQLHRQHGWPDGQFADDLLAYVAGVIADNSRNVPHLRMLFREACNRLDYHASYLCEHGWVATFYEKDRDGKFIVRAPT